MFFNPFKTSISLLKLYKRNAEPNKKIVVNAVKAKSK